MLKVTKILKSNRMLWRREMFAFPYGSKALIVYLGLVIYRMTYRDQTFKSLSPTGLLNSKLSMLDLVPKASMLKFYFRLGS
jgi:hypothetical protein